MVLAQQPLPPLHQKESTETLQTPAELLCRMLVFQAHPDGKRRSSGPELCGSEHWRLGQGQPVLAAGDPNLQEVIKRLIMQRRSNL